MVSGLPYYRPAEFVVNLMRTVVCSQVQEWRRPRTIRRLMRLSSSSFCWLIVYLCILIQLPAGRILLRCCFTDNCYCCLLKGMGQRLKLLYFFDLRNNGIVFVNIIILKKRSPDNDLLDYKWSLAVEGWRDIDEYFMVHQMVQ